MSDKYLVDGTYPAAEGVEVAFEPDPRASVIPPAEAFCITHQGEWVGEAVLIQRDAKGAAPDAYLTKLYIDTPYRGRGLGTAALLQAARMAHESGRGLCTDPIGEYEDVRHLWQKLAERGIARVVKLADPVSNRSRRTAAVLNHDRLRIPSPAETATSTD